MLRRERTALDTRAQELGAARDEAVASAGRLQQELSEARRQLEKEQVCAVPRCAALRCAVHAVLRSAVLCCVCCASS